MQGIPPRWSPRRITRRRAQFYYRILIDPFSGIQSPLAATWKQKLERMAEKKYIERKANVWRLTPAGEATSYLEIGSPKSWSALDERQRERWRRRFTRLAIVLSGDGGRIHFPNHRKTWRSHNRDAISELHQFRVQLHDDLVNLNRAREKVRDPPARGRIMQQIIRKQNVGSIIVQIMAELKTGEIDLTEYE